VRGLRASARRGSARALGAVGLRGALLLAALASRAAAETEDPACGTMIVVMRAGSVAYRLPHTFLRAGTDSVVSRRGVWRAGSDYFLDRVRGELRVLHETVPGESLVVHACWLMAPPPLEIQLMRYRPGGGTGPDTAAASAAPAPAPPRPGLARDPSASPAGASLTVTGNKTLAVDFGSNQDAFLRQSLDLTVSGSLAPGVQLTGVLSDRNTPLTAAGSTQDLQALDRVLIELKGPRGTAALGDVSLDMSDGEFSRIARRLQGVRAQWSTGRSSADFAAASAPGEFFRLQLFGVEGRQGPYALTDRDGGIGISVVAGSEVVLLDGERLTRGEGADYAIDYDAARVTFTNRRPISSSSRITIEYQYTLNRYRRNLLAAGTRWQGNGWYAFARGVSEADDRGRPIDATLDNEGLAVLALAGDSATRAIEPGVVAAGGDYDTLRADGGRLVYAYVGPGGGRFSVPFARVGPGRGDYASYDVGSGTAYRYVGAGLGEFQIGRGLPLPESHQLWAGGGGGHAGVFGWEMEGALSNDDRNTFSSLDDHDNVGLAGRLRVGAEGRAPGTPFERVGIAFDARRVERRFAAFSPLERPFAEESWGLPVGADIDHPRRVEASAFARSPRLGEFKLTLGRLDTPGGFAARRGEGDWVRRGILDGQAHYETAQSDESGRRAPHGDRQMVTGNLRLRLAWLEPAVRLESDARRSPGDSVRSGLRTRSAGVELASGRRVPVRVVMGWDLRRDATLDRDSFADQSETRILRAGLDTPEERAFSAAVRYQRRMLEPLAAPARGRSDLGSFRLRGEDRARGMSAQLGVEVTSEGENQSVRTVTFVGPGRGGYDALGNFVGTGDYTLAVVVSPEVDRVSRAATTARLGWQFGHAEAWRGSRFQFDFESETRRRGALGSRDPVISPGAALADPGLARATLLQRGELDLAPASRALAFRLLAERHVSGDRTYTNFSQTLDDRTASLRWQARPSDDVTSEVQTSWRKQVARQALLGGGGLERSLLESGASAQLVYTPGAALRAAAVGEAKWVRPEGTSAVSRTVRLGPDVGIAVGARGHLELSARRAFIGGAPAVSLLPSAEPAGAPRWEASSRLDYRVHESTTASISANLVERPGISAQVTGRAEVRAFF
jgi:hypothetical protein